MSWRAEFERRSGPSLRRLAALPRWSVLVGVVVLLVGGLLLHGAVAALLLGVLAAFLGWLLMLSWPALQPVPRLLRLLVVAALVGIAVTRF